VGGAQGDDPPSLLAGTIDAPDDQGAPDPLASSFGPNAQHPDARDVGRELLVVVPDRLVELQGHAPEDRAVLDRHVDLGSVRPAGHVSQLGQVLLPARVARAGELQVGSGGDLAGLLVLVRGHEPNLHGLPA